MKTLRASPAYDRFVARYRRVVTMASWSILGVAAAFSFLFVMVVR